MNYSDHINKDSPRDVNMDETGFYKYIMENGSVSPLHKNHAANPLDDIKPYLETFGFVKGEDNIDSPVLDNLKHIWVYARQCVRRNGHDRTKRV